MTRDELILHLLKELHEIGRPDYVIKNDVGHAYRVLDERLSRAREACKDAARKGSDYYIMEYKKAMEAIKKEVKTCCYCKNAHNLSGNLKCSVFKDIVDSDFFCKKWEGK